MDSAANLRKRSFGAFVRLGALYSLIVCGTALVSFAREFRAERILIQPKSRAALKALSGTHKSNRVTVLQEFPAMGGLQILRLPSGLSAAAAIAQYQKSGLVEFAEPDQVGLVFATPNDPQYLNGSLWGLHNTGQSGGTPGADIHASEGWDLITSASNIIVAVLDTGVRYTHEDLAANMWTSTNDGSHGLNAVDQNSDPSDSGVHGTQVAGVLGAAGNNGKGVTGVAWQIQMIACRCFTGSLIDSGSGNVSDVITCMDYARTNGAKIINASFGFANSLALSNAVLSLRDAGIIVVAACGNSATNVDVQTTFPACYHFDNVVSVAYTTRNDVLAGPSNYGLTNVHLAAPGENILSTFPATDSFYYPNSGTSFAAPYVAGALALVRARFPAEPYQLAIRRVLEGTDPLPSLAGKCITGGRLNLRKALSPPIRLALTLSGGSFELQVTAGPNRTCVLESSSDLVAWTAIHTNTTSANGSFNFVEAQDGSVAKRFYRAISKP